MHVPFDHDETAAIRLQAERTAYHEHSVPLFLTSSFVFDDAEHGRALFAEEQPGVIYSRFSNPNTTELINKLCWLEGGADGLVFASGMAAVFVSLAGLLRAGDHALFSRSLFGSTVQLANQILPRWGISTSYVSLTDTETWAEALQPTTRLLFIETPSNPGLDLIDLRAAADFCRRHNIILIVDNCFATPYLQKPLELGVHLVVHSATKWIDGQGRVLGGAIVGPADLIKELRFFARHTGPALSPFNAWTLSKSLETLHVRMDRHCATAHALAQWLEREFPDDLRAVRYPFLPSHPQYRLACEQMKAGGGIVCIVVRGGAQRAFRFVEALRWLSYTANLGDARTTVTHPASTTHSKLTEAEREVAGIEPGLIRISVGLEHLEDLQNELRQALVASRNA